MEDNKLPEIPLIVSKGNASFLSEQFLSFSNNIGFTHDKYTPYKVMMGDNGDIIFRPWVEPDFLYHYCTPNGFKGILSSRTLRMTDPRFCNDKTEQIEFITILEDLKNKVSNIEITDDILNKQIELISAHKEIPEEEKKIIVQEIANLKELNIEERIKRQQNNLSPFFNLFYNDLTSSITDTNPRYISCFCEQGDVKSQWMEYTENGKGFSIGFNRKHLLEASDIHLRPVLYHKNQQFELLNWAIFQYEFIKKNSQHWLHEVIPVIKNQAFHEEREWRLIHIPSKDINEHSLKYGWIGNDKIYYELPLKPEYISEIILGPQCEMTVQECLEHLKSLGLELNENQVRKSAVPYISSQNKK